jgi:peptide/nickel transport system permease protein
MKVGFTPVLNTSDKSAPVTPVVRVDEAKGTVS